MRSKRSALITALAVCALAAGAWAQEKKAGEEMEKQIRLAGFQYYVGTLFGDADEYMKATRLPLYVVRDGAGKHRDEKETRAVLAASAEHIKAAKVSQDDRNQIVKNLIAIFDEASIQFIGANTATLTFLVKHGEAKEGDQLATLTLYRKDGQWKVIAEVTDSAPVPPEYLK